jgi:hypothetical protein
LNNISSSGAGQSRVKAFFFLCLLAAGALLVHGYHPFVEDAEIYVPGIKKLLNPALYPLNQVFFASHAGMTLYPNLIAWSARLIHLPLEWVLLGWHFGCILLLLAGCWKLGNGCFRSEPAAWGGSILVAGLLTIPVAGTALYIMDQYVNPRSFSTATAVWIMGSALDKKYFRAAIWTAVTALIHPLMALFSAAFVLLLLVVERVRPSRTVTAVLLPASLFPPLTPAYLRTLNSHGYFFILRWEWFEWLGFVGPTLILWGIARWAKRSHRLTLHKLCDTTIVFSFLCLLAALVITVPRSLVRFAELQPMRGLLLVYVALFVICGGLLAEYLLQAKLWRWIAVFFALSAGMFYAQRQLFPASDHLEFPGRKPDNVWVETFLWTRRNTPVDAYFALNPEHMRLPGEDQHGFRAVAERSMLADAVKDSGAVTMFPALAQTWQEQVDAQRGWKGFRRPDFENLRKRFGVNWFVLEQPQTLGMDCPYENAALSVCRIPIEDKSQGTVK